MHWERVCSVDIVLFRDIFSHLRRLRYFPHRYSLWNDHRQMCGVLQGVAA